MRIANGVLCAILIFFAVLQYNDPDALLWFLIYAIAAVWPGLAAAKPDFVATSRPVRLSGTIAVVACVVGFFVNAGTIGSNWIHVETAREAFGYVICAAAIGLALYATRSSASASPA